MALVDQAHSRIALGQSGFTHFQRILTRLAPRENQRTQYRPDIDGLRAVAVCLVVGFHVFPNVVKGGYVGVDIFFVISGFLISSIIFRSVAQSQFSYVDFYIRRIRRIFPALVVVLI